MLNDKLIVRQSQHLADRAGRTGGDLASREHGELKSVHASQEPWKSNVSRLIQSTVRETSASSQLPLEFTLPAGRSAVRR